MASDASPQIAGEQLFAGFLLGTCTMITEQHLSVRRTARYYVLSSLAPPKELWFILHGYGQLAAEFIKHFSLLDDGSRLLVAPEALNRFYLVGPETKPAPERPVGATWMTREDRDYEIDDYVAYLDAVAAEVLEPFRARGAVPRIVVLAFSQGTATAARWIARGTIRPTDLILWGGLLPPELDHGASVEQLRRTALHLVVGSRDGFLSASRVSEEELRLKTAGLSYGVTRYDGGHGIAKETLRDIAKRLRGDA